jgi:hypothetical protein
MVVTVLSKKQLFGPIVIFLAHDVLVIALWNALYPPTPQLQSDPVDPQNYVGAFPLMRIADVRLAPLR